MMPNFKVSGKLMTSEVRSNTRHGPHEMTIFGRSKIDRDEYINLEINCIGKIWINMQKETYQCIGVGTGGAGGAMAPPTFWSGGANNVNWPPHFSVTHLVEIKKFHLKRKNLVGAWCIGDVK